jgi:hypothetical protein
MTNDESSRMLARNSAILQFVNKGMVIVEYNLSMNHSCRIIFRPYRALFE